MITRRHLLLAILAACLLTVFLIAIVPIRSQTAGEYDPWLDYNDDGTINIMDIAATARAFGTAGDPTKNVTVTNWPLPSKVLWCGDWHIVATSSYASVTPIGATPTIYVGDYTTMTVSMNFSSVLVVGGFGYLQPYVYWSNSPGLGFDTSDRLVSTMYQLYPHYTLGNPVFGGTMPVSTDSYALKAPYVSFGINPMFANYQNLNVSVNLSMYVYLSNARTGGSVHKTMQWYEYRQSDQATDPNYCVFGYYNLAGFGQLTIFLLSNVTWTVSVQRAVGGYGAEIGYFTLPANSVTSKTYTMDGDGYNLLFYNPSAKPWNIQNGFYTIS